MKKTQFMYQRWHLRMLCSIIVLPLALVVQRSLAKIMGIEYANIWYVLICVVVMLLCLAAYYQLTKHYKWFARTGYYWVDEGIVHLQMQNRVYALENVKWLRGTTVSVYGMAKAGMMIVQLEKKKLVLADQTIEAVNSFADSKLLPLFEITLEHNPELEKDDTLDFWYEVKKPNNVNCV